MLRKLTIENTSDTETLSNLTLTLSSSPNVLKQKQWHIDSINPNGFLTIRDRDIELDGGLLMGLTEGVKGDVTFRLESNEDVLTETTLPIELLACNEWGGSHYMPELLAAFVLSNAPQIDTILKKTSAVLKEAGKDSSINGYQSGSRQRVWEIASAVYTAITRLNLTYASPPASFETNGQKIRLPETILSGGLATCLDTAVLFAATLEQAGLNPLIVLTEGHAFTGVWLQPEDFSTVLVDDPQLLRKHCQLNDMVMFETTLATQSPAPPFSTAIEQAIQQISPEKEVDFVAAVYIKQARSHQIKPLGIANYSNTTGRADETSAVEYVQPLEQAPALPSFDKDLTEIVVEAETPATRIERWQRKLLDLTLRNPLLNHRSSKSSLTLVCPDPGLLEDQLADGKKNNNYPSPQRYWGRPR